MLRENLWSLMIVMHNHTPTHTPTHTYSIPANLKASIWRPSEIIMIQKIINISYICSFASAKTVDIC